MECVMWGRIVEWDEECILFRCNNKGYKIVCDCQNTVDEVKLYYYIDNNKFTDETKWYGFTDKQKYELFLKISALKGVGFFSAFLIVSKVPTSIIEEARKSGNYLLLNSSGVKENILRNVTKRENIKDYDLKYLVKTLVGFGYRKRDVNEVLEIIYSQNKDINVLVKDAIIRLNEMR